MDLVTMDRHGKPWIWWFLTRKILTSGIEFPFLWVRPKGRIYPANKVSTKVKVQLKVYIFGQSCKINYRFNLEHHQFDFSAGGWGMLLQGKTKKHFSKDIIILDLAAYGGLCWPEEPGVERLEVVRCCCQRSAWKVAGTKMYLLSSSLLPFLVFKLRNLFLVEKMNLYPAYL